MLTLTGSMYIEGYTVFQDDQNDIDGVLSRINSVLGAEQKRAGALVDSLRGASGISTDSLDGINADTSFGSLSTNSPPPAPKPDQIVTARRFYVLPDHPDIAMDPKGNPIFSMIIYRDNDERLNAASVPTDDVGGGILTFTVELTVPPKTLDKITQKLKALVNGNSSSPTDVEVTIVEFTEGKVSIAVAGEGTDATGNQFVKSAVGTGDIIGVADNRKAVMVNLTQDGAAMFSQLDKLRTLPVNVQYQLGYEHRLLGVTLRVWCDVSSSYQLIQTTYHQTDSQSSGYLGLSTDNTTTDKIAKATEVMTRQKTCGVEVIPSSSAIDQDTLTALEKFGEDMLQKELDKVVTANPVPDSVDRSWLDKWGSDASNSLNFTLDQRMVLVQKYTPSANLQNIFQRGDAADMITWIDLRIGFFTMLKVPIRINADFTKLPISQVVVTVTYKSQDPNGTKSDRTESFDFVDGGTIQTFLAYANTLDAVAYDWQAQVHYKNADGGTNDTFTISRSRVKDRFLVVDVGTMGMISVDFSLGLVDLDKFPKAAVSVRYTSAAGKKFEDQFNLDKDNPEHLWTAIIKEQSSRIYEYKVDWQAKTAGGTNIIAGQWQSTNTLSCTVDAPIQDHISVSVNCSADFKGTASGADPIAQVIVGLLYSDPDNNIHTEGTVSFTADGQTGAWSADLANPNKRDYQYRYAVIYKGGIVKEFPPDKTKYFAGEPGYITVGPIYDLKVDVYPTLLQLGGFPDSAAMVEVDLTYTSDDGKINNTGSFTFSKTDCNAQKWFASTGGKGEQPYIATVTYFSLTGQVVKMPSQPHSGTKYVVPPMPQTH